MTRQQKLRKRIERLTRKKLKAELELISAKRKLRRELRRELVA